MDITDFTPEQLIQWEILQEVREMLETMQRFEDRIMYIQYFLLLVAGLSFLILFLRFIFSIFPKNVY